MITDLNTPAVFQLETEITVTTVKIKSSLLKMAAVKVKQFSKWLNPKNWFSCLSDIDIDLSEFACKKTLPKE